MEPELEHQLLMRALEIATKTESLEEAEQFLNSYHFPTYGIEHIFLADRELSYINLGDTYDTTFCEEDGKFFMSSWGEWYEEAEREYCEENDAIRCGYCGEFTPMDKDDWREVICKSCGNRVGG